MKKENRILLIGCGISLLIIILLFAIRANEEDWLDINIQWIGVAILPLILALILGGFIKKFSGFGIELELVSKEPLSTSSTIVEVLVSTVAQDKASLESIYNISGIDRIRINVLRFELQKRQYYNDQVIITYLNYLPNVRFFEIVDAEGKFRSLSRINSHEIIHNQQHHLIQSFINSLENNRTVDLVNTTSNTIDIATTAVNALKEIRTSGKSFIAVLGKEKQLIGVVFKSKLEEYLATTLINAIEKNN